MNTRVLLALVCVLATAAHAQKDSLAKRDQALLQGEWSMVSGEMDGSSYSGIMLTGSKRVAVGNETTVTIAGQLFMKATFTLDPTAKPKAIDYAMTGGATAGRSQLGIYDIWGDSARFCFSEPGFPRPTAFTTAAGNHRTCSVWARKRP
ncbi:MAG TPA: TIGR03067 domain-containing protein [Gemmatimonadaceae bacterium]|nr:TIGR03067 domain-containing protein [Gemmatimonadaceae bacterium]